MTIQKASRLTAIVITGLLVGTLDITAAIINFIVPTYRNPIIIFQFITSGVVGSEAAFSDGWWMAVVGFVAHYCIATYWTAIYYYAYPAIRYAIPNKFVAGLAYGVVVWLAMNLIVLPLSRVSAGPFNLTSSVIGVVILMLAIGLPISLRASKFFSETK